MSDTHPLLRGIELPPALPRGRPRAEDVEPWLDIVGQLLSRGVSSPSQLRNVLGIGYRTAERWITEVRKRWAAGLTDERVNWRRETLYHEADEVARYAWRQTAAAATATEKASLMKVVLMANARKASLTGLDTMEIKVRQDVRVETTIDVVARVETDLGLAPGALESIGRQAAVLLSKPGGGSEQVIDVQPENDTDLPM